jgi:DNA repair exonuclease SbcCD ATPase subunit
MQKLRLHQADEREAISHEAMRQRIESLEASLAERQRDLASAEEARHMLEDALEDANRHLDGARLEHDRALQDADAAVAGRREAEQARDQLKAALEKLQQNADLVSATDLRDARLSPPKTPLGMDSLGTSRRWPAALIGMLLGAGGVVTWVVHSGNARIFEPVRHWLGL